MMIKYFYLSIILMTIISCNMKEQTVNYQEIREEIREVEGAFKELALKEGIKTAFLRYAAPNAVLSRQNKLFKGIREIEKYFDENELPYTDVVLDWEPDFVEVSQAGDMAYTYGQYKFSYTDEGGIKYIDTGIFHTIWKKQPDGSWLYIWD